MAKKQAGKAKAGAVVTAASFAATSNDFVQIYAPTQGATVGTSVGLKAVVKALGGGMGTTAEVRLAQATALSIGSPTTIIPTFTYPNVDATLTLTTGLNVIEVRLLVNGTVVASDQVIVSVSP